MVVGDQSSGKSSLLESLTGIPFAVASQLCTRFATQVSFIRVVTAHETRRTVTIIPAPNSSEPYKQTFDKYYKQLAKLTPEIFTGVVNEATELMGLPTSVQ